MTSLITLDTSDIILNNFNQTFLRSLESELRQLMCAVVQSLQTSGTVDLKTWHSFSSYMVKENFFFVIILFENKLIF